MKPDTTLLIVIFAIAVSLLGCAQLNVADSAPGTGSGSEVEALCGSVVDRDGKPVEGARVRIRPSKYLALYPATNVVGADSFTNNLGHFRFNKMPADSYTIEVNKGVSYGRLIRFAVAPTDTFPIVIPAASLRRTGSIKGKINLPITDDTARPLIAIYGLEHCEKSLITQDFSFRGIPPGAYNLRVIPYKGSNLILELQNIEVSSDSTTDVGILNLTILTFFKGCMSRSCDSLAVRALLDANGLTSVPVHSVAGFDLASSRVVALNLSGMHVSNLTKDIGSLSNLRRLDVHANSIRLVPQEISYLDSLSEFIADSNEIVSLPYEISYCVSLRLVSLRYNSLFEVNTGFCRLNAASIDLSHNSLSVLPETFVLMVGLRTLYLDCNNISSLPAAIAGLRLKEFSIKNNKLCAIPDTIASWIASYDSAWAVTQACAHTTNKDLKQYP